VRGVIADASPLVALLDQSDFHHASRVAALSALRDPLVTVWPAFTEAMYLLGSSWRGQNALWSRVETAALRLAPLDEADAIEDQQLVLDEHGFGDQRAPPRPASRATVASRCRRRTVRSRTARSYQHRNTKNCSEL
jgi:hypothetical protein